MAACLKLRCCLCLVLLALLLEASAAAATSTDGSHQQQSKRATPRKLLQYTGSVVAGTPRYYNPAPRYYNPAPVTTYSVPDAASINPAVGVLNQAMSSGQAPSDIASMRARGWVRGKIMGQRVNAQGAATASLGNNAYGGVTGVADAAGQFETDGRYGHLGGQGQARAAVATTREAAANGYTVLNGAAAAQASGSVYGGLPSGRGFYARGSASAQAEGTVMYMT